MHLKATQEQLEIDKARPWIANDGEKEHIIVLFEYCIESGYIGIDMSQSTQGPSLSLSPACIIANTIVLQFVCFTTTQVLISPKLN